MTSLKTVECKTVKIRVWECLLCGGLNVVNFNIKQLGIVECKKCGNRYKASLSVYNKIHITTNTKKD